MKELLQKRWYIWTLGAIMILALFLRVWDLNEMLYFKMDQARDATIAKNALENGLGDLPLLGPRAAGTYLRLGPIFYYFQYVSVFVTQNIEPIIMVYPDILFSILAIPMAYVFLSQFFLRWTSVFLSGLLSVSFIAVQYGRFAWNPNQALFWSILFMLCVYKVSTLNDKRKAGWWLLGTAVSYGVLSQLHFSALLVFPIITFLFWIFYRPRKIKKIFWASAFAVLLLFYVPMILSEIVTDGDNAKQFSYALTHKTEDKMTGDKTKEFSLGEKLNQSIKLHGKYYSLLLSSYGNMDNKFFVYVFYVMITFALWRGCHLWRQTEDRKKNAFLFLMFCWFFVFFLFYTKLSFTVLKPRFWLLTMMVPYFISGLLFEYIYRTGHKKRGKLIVGSIIVLLFAGNLYATGYWFWSVKNQKEARGGTYVRRLILKQDNLVELEQMRNAIDCMVERSIQKNQKICYYTEGEYRSSYMYLFGVYHPEVEVKRVEFSVDTNEECVFFSIKNGGSDRKLNLPKEEEYFHGVQKWQFGVVTVWEIQKDEVTFGEYLAQKELKKKQKRAEDRQKKEMGENDDKSGVENKKPCRKERVFWKNIFGEKYED